MTPPVAAGAHFQEGMMENNEMEVTQADRDAAADCLVANNGRFASYVADLMRKGAIDDSETVKAFARHRTTALAAKEAENAELRAKVERLREGLMNVRDWAASLTVTDMNEIVADNGITAGMVVGQEAGEQVRRIDRAIATLAETQP